MQRSSSRIIAVSAALIVLSLISFGILHSRQDRRTQAYKRETSAFKVKLDAFIVEASKLDEMTSLKTEQPVFEEQLKIAESSFVEADGSWPNDISYKNARQLLVDGLKEWRLCDELRIAVILQRVSASANSQVSVLMQDEKLKTKSDSEFEKSSDNARDLHVHEERASHSFHQAIEYLNKGNRGL